MRRRQRATGCPHALQCAEQYLDEQAAGGLEPSSLKSKRGLLGRGILPLPGTRKVDQIRTADFTTLRMAMVGAGRKPKTVNNGLTVLSAMVRWSHVQHDLPEPRFHVNPVKVPKDRCAKFYDFEPFERLVLAAKRLGPERLALVLLGSQAGLRMSESGPCKK